MATHSMNVQPRYFDLLQEGKKKVEFRILDEKRQKISIGDTIQFICQNRDNDAYDAVVSYLIQSTNFIELLHHISPPCLGGLTIEEQLNDLHSFYDRSDEEKCGVVAIVLK